METERKKFWKVRLEHIWWRWRWSELTQIMSSELWIMVREHFLSLSLSLSSFLIFLSFQKRFSFQERFFPFPFTFRTFSWHLFIKNLSLVEHLFSFTLSSSSAAGTFKSLSIRSSYLLLASRVGNRRVKGRESEWKNHSKRERERESHRESGSTGTPMKVERKKIPTSLEGFLIARES